MDNVEHPKHYTSHPSGVECITITEHMGFNLGNAFKYIWRADLKHDAIEDLRKAEWYIRREIDRRSGATKESARAADGTYDNSATMRREHWFDGRVTCSISADVVDRNGSGCGPFGSYPDLPRQ